MKILKFILLSLIPAIGYSQELKTCNIERMLEKWALLSEVSYTKAILKNEYYSKSLKEREKNLIDQNNLFCFFIKDSSELGMHYSRPYMDEPSIIDSGYIPYFYYPLYRLHAIKNLHPLIYIEDKDEWSCTYLSVYSKDGNLLDKLPIDHDEMDQYFFRSLISPADWSVLRVTYTLIAERDWEDGEDLINSEIKTEFYQFDFQQRKFVLKNSETKTSSVYYFRFAQGENYADDPFSRYNIDETKAKFEQMIQDTKIQNSIRIRSPETDAK